MGTILALLANPVMIRIALALIEAFISNKNASNEVKSSLAKIAEFLRANGVEKATSRYEAETQVTDGSSMWDEREKQEKEKSK